MKERISYQPESGLETKHSRELQPRTRRRRQAERERKLFGQDLRHAREEVAKLSRTQLARRLGHLDTKFIQRWEVGKVIPRPETLIDLMQTFDCSLRALVPSIWKQRADKLARRSGRVADLGQAKEPPRATVKTEEDLIQRRKREFMEKRQQTKEEGAV